MEFTHVYHSRQGYGSVSTYKHLIFPCTGISHFLTYTYTFLSHRNELVT